MNDILTGRPRIQVVYDNGYDYEDYIASNPTNPQDAVTHAEAEQIARSAVQSALSGYVTDSELTAALADYATLVAVNALSRRLSGFVETSDYNLEKATLESRITNLLNRMTTAEGNISTLENVDVTSLEMINTLIQQAVQPFTAEIFPKFVKPTRQGLERTFALEFGKIYPPVTTSNRMIVTFNGSVIFNGIITPADNLITPLPVTRNQADNIATNTQPSWTLYDVQVRFRLNNDPTDLAFYPLKVVIDRV